ncbi:hypothetical protein SAMN04515669_3201 [Jiangella sp. DSM 45060]|nr:hypothetical protein SAMN04515669_3201 [Jiangella sp. DSM 45060]
MSPRRGQEQVAELDLSGDLPRETLPAARSIVTMPITTPSRSTTKRPGRRSGSSGSARSNSSRGRGPPMYVPTSGEVKSSMIAGRSRPSGSRSRSRAVLMGAGGQLAGSAWLTAGNLPDTPRDHGSTTRVSAAWHSVSSRTSSSLAGYSRWTSADPVRRGGDRGRDGGGVAGGEQGVEDRLHDRAAEIASQVGGARRDAGSVHGTDPASRARRESRRIRHRPRAPCLHLLAVPGPVPRPFRMTSYRSRSRVAATKASRGCCTDCSDTTSRP